MNSVILDDALKVDIALNELLINRPRAYDFFSGLNGAGDLYLFGGAVRHWLANDSGTPRDLDIVVDADTENLDRYFEGIVYTRNRYGGYKVIIDSIKFDVWELRSTWAFYHGLIKETRADRLHQTVFLNIDAAVYDLTARKLHDSKLRSAFRDRLLDIVLEENPYPSLNLVRALIYKKKYGMSFSERLTVYFRNWLSSIGDASKAVQMMLQVQYSHYGQEFVGLTEHEMIREVSENVEGLLAY